MQPEAIKDEVLGSWKPFAVVSSCARRKGGQVLASTYESSLSEEERSVEEDLR